MNKQFHNTSKKEQHRYMAFTLIELLVVVSIIAVMVSILMPALNKPRSQAPIAFCLSNYHNVAVAIEMYRTQADSERIWEIPNNGGQTADFAFEYETPRSAGMHLDLVDNFNTLEDRQILFCPSVRNLAHDYNYIIGYGSPGTVISPDKLQELPQGDPKEHYSFWGTHVWFWKKRIELNGVRRVNSISRDLLMGEPDERLRVCRSWFPVILLM